MKHLHPPHAQIALIKMQIETEEKYLLDVAKDQRRFMDMFHAASYSEQRPLGDKIREYSGLVSKTKKIISNLKSRLENLEKGGEMLPS